MLLTSQVVYVKFISLFFHVPVPNSLNTALTVHSISPSFQRLVGDRSCDTPNHCHVF